jgi:hypothetical protein
MLMATAAMACDNLSINRINPYTWSGTYGVYSDGFPSTLPIDGSYITQMSNEPTEYPEPPPGADNQNMDLSGSMYLKTAESSPAPFRMFPARKNEFPDGTVTWIRPDLPWSWVNGGRAPGDTWTASNKGNGLLFWIFIIVIALYVYSRIKK